MQNRTKPNRTEQNRTEPENHFWAEEVREEFTSQTGSDDRDAPVSTHCRAKSPVRMKDRTIINFDAIGRNFFDSVAIFIEVKAEVLNQMMKSM